MPITTRLAATSLALLLAGGLAACGDDDESTADDPTEESGGDAATGLGTDGCDAFTELTAAFVGDPTAAAEPAQALVDAAPADLADSAAAVASAFEAAADDPEALGGPEFTAAWSEVGDAAFESCDTDEAVEVQGIDYAFSGLPESLPAGRVAIRLTNDSESGDPHELVLVKRLDDTPAAELLQLPPEELFSHIEMQAVVFVEEVGADATALVDLEAGSYLAVCTLPTAGDEADPHAAHGMTQELEVS